MVQRLHPGDCIAETPKPLDTGGAPAGQPSTQTAVTTAETEIKNVISFSKIVTDVEGAAKTFVGYIAKQYAAIYGKEPEIEQVVDASINYIVPALVIVMDAAGQGALAPEIVAVINEAQSDLKVVGALIYDFGPSPSATKIAAAVAAKLAGIETAGHFKDAATQAKFALIVRAVGVLATALANAVAAATSKAA
jgi:hypothetical protein